MRYTKYITAIVTFFIAGACAVADLDEQAISVGTTGTDAVKVMGRVTRFSDYNVGTRGAKTGDEAKVTSMALAVFPINAAGDGVDPCVSYYFMKSSDPLFTIVRDEANVEKGKKYALYIFANMPQMDFDDQLYGGNGDDIYTEGVGKTLDALLSLSHNVKGVDIPDEGFPMMGSLGDYFSKTGDTLVGDGNEFVLYPDANALPTVNGAHTDLLNIPMKALYAKMVFTIKVTADQVLEGKYPPQFSLEGWQVHNVPNSLDFKSDTHPIEFIADPDVVTDDNGSAVGASTVSFSFYLPERYLKPNKSGADVYPDELKEENVREEDKKYLQRFKPLLVEEQDATYVTFTGNFRDHRNENYKVSYDIYVGKDNYANFDVERNCQYNNYITIRGITTAKDQVDAKNKVAIDHRVTVTERDPIILNLRRETLLDSHFEVRPLRLRAADRTSTYSDVKVEILNAEFPDDETKTPPTWIRLEHMTGNAGNSTLHLESGKRKYFTYGLVTGKDASGNTEQGNISDNTEQTLSVGYTDEIVWIYVDECESYDKGDGVRSAIVRVSYTVDGTLYQEDFIINQRLLFPVTYTNNTEATTDDRSYLIEYHEEYLYNYDAEDSYGQTEEEGMAWGLKGVQLSWDTRALYMDGAGNSTFTSVVNDIIIPYYSPFYDFYLPDDIKDISVLTEEEKASISHERSGYIFCNAIITDSKNSERIDAEYAIGVRDLSSNPASAVEYCYNKNKRNANGVVESIKWYLPAIDEIEDIVMSEYGNSYKTYSRFIEFQNKYYWSSQPAFIHNAAHYNILVQRGGSYMKDNIDYARATSVDYAGGEFSKVGSKMINYYECLKINNFNDHSENSIPESGYVIDYDPPFYDRYYRLFPKYSIEEGYHPRTKKNRIRCVYKAVTTN